MRIPTMGDFLPLSSPEALTTAPPPGILKRVWMNLGRVKRVEERYVMEPKWGEMGLESKSLDLLGPLYTRVGGSL